LVHAPYSTLFLLCCYSKCCLLHHVAQRPPVLALHILCPIILPCGAMMRFWVPIILIALRPLHGQPLVYNESNMKSFLLRLPRRRNTKGHSPASATKSGHLYGLPTEIKQHVVNFLLVICRCFCYMQSFSPQAPW
jgi:hypothetical protein